MTAEAPCRLAGSSSAALRNHRGERAARQGRSARARTTGARGGAPVPAWPRPPPRRERRDESRAANYCQAENVAGSARGAGRSDDARAPVRGCRPAPRGTPGPNAGQATRRSTFMSDGTADETKGRLKEAAGDLTGDRELKDEGKVDRASGKAKDAVGGGADKARGGRRKD